MQPQTEFMLNLKEYIENRIHIPVNLTELSEDGRVYAELGAGGTVRRYIRMKTGIYSYPVLFLAKGTDEPGCMERLSRICNCLKERRKFPDGNNYQFRSLKVDSEPNKAGRQEDGQVVYSCIIKFEIYY